MLYFYFLLFRNVNYCKYTIKINKVINKNGTKKL